MGTLEELKVAREAHWRESKRRVDELAQLASHLAAATARFVELAWEIAAQPDCVDPAGFLAYRCGITLRESREYLRVAEALQELPVIRGAFSRGELTFTKVRALTRVATPSSETGLLTLANAMTAAQLERALRAFRRVAAEEASQAHALEYVDWYFDDDGSLVLRARLAAEDGTLLVLALDAACERILSRRREQRARGAELTVAVEPDRPARLEALLELTTARDDPHGEPAAGAQLIVNVDAAALTTDAPGRSELERGPVIAPETARRLGCDAAVVARIERDGLSLSAGRARRTVPPALRRLLEQRDDSTCCFPGCERQRRLQAHHRRHWAHGGETSLANLVLLCHHHHRLVHEGGYEIEDDEHGGLRFRNSRGLVCTTMPPRPPPGSEQALRDANARQGLTITAQTNRNGTGDPLDLALTVAAIAQIAA